MLAVVLCPSFLFHSNNYFAPEVSNGVQSHTLNGGMYTDEKGFKYIDLPGPDDTRGEQEKDWAVWTIATTLSLLDRLQGVIFVIDYDVCIKNGRADGLRKVIDEMINFFGSPAADSPTGRFYESMFFVFTKVSPANTKARDRIVDVLTQLQEEFSAKARELGEKFQTKFLGAGSVEVDELLKERVEMATLRHLVVERLLTAIQRNRFLLSRPDSDRSCEEQRRRIREEIGRLPSMNKKHLLKAVECRKTQNFTVLKNLVHLLMHNGKLRSGGQNFLDRKRECVSSFQDLLNIFEKEQQRAELIAIDWEAEKDRMGREKEATCQKMERSILEMEQESRHAAQSKALVLLFVGLCGGVVLLAGEGGHLLQAKVYFCFVLSRQGLFCLQFIFLQADKEREDLHDNTGRIYVTLDEVL